jgi:hypothetical protein
MPKTTPRYPDIRVEVGSPFLTAMRVRMALKQAGVSKEERDRFTLEAFPTELTPTSTTLAAVRAWVSTK